MIQESWLNVFFKKRRSFDFLQIGPRDFYCLFIEDKFVEDYGSTIDGAALTKLKNFTKTLTFARVVRAHKNRHMRHLRDQRLPTGRRKLQM